MLKIVLFLLLVLHSGVNSYNTETNIKDVEYEETNENPELQAADSKPEDLISPTSTTNEDADPKAATPQTGSKKQQLYLSPQQIDALADKILTIHGIEPNAQASQDDKKVERLLNVVANVETNLENKLKEVREEQLKQLEENKNVDGGDDIKLEDITRVIVEGLNEEIDAEQEEGGTQTDLPEQENREDEDSSQTVFESELREDVNTEDGENKAAEENLDGEEKRTEVNETDEDLNTVAEENVKENAVERDVEGVAIEADGNDDEVAPESNGNAAERDTKDIAIEGDGNTETIDAEAVAVEADGNTVDRDADDIPSEADENAENVAVEEDGTRDDENIVVDNEPKLEVETNVEPEDVKESDEEIEEEAVIADTTTNEQNLADADSEEVTNIEADTKIEEKLEEENLIKDEDNPFEDVEAQESEGDLENLKISITVDEAIINEENETDQSEEVKDTTNTETCNAEEGDCDQGSKTYLYSIEDNINAVDEEETLESNTNNGYFDKIFNFIYDRF